jgi:putative ABC transport system substrate-binding protein
MILRRDFITLLGGAATWPLVARAQQGDRVRRIGVLQAGDESDPVRKTYVSAFTQALAGLGWTVGRNLRMDLRWGGDAPIAFERSRGVRMPITQRDCLSTLPLAYPNLKASESTSQEI